MLEKLKQSSSYVSLLKQYEMLSPRDRMALKVLGVALGLAILFYGMWQPALDYKLEAERNLKYNQDLHTLVESNKAVLASLSRQSGASGRSKLNSQQLVSSVTNMAKQHGLNLKRFEPSGENKLKVWLDDASFDKMVSWLSKMKKSLGVKVEQISVDKDDAPGKISARLTLSS